MPAVSLTAIAVHSHRRRTWSDGELKGFIFGITILGSLALVGIVLAIFFWKLYVQSENAVQYYETRCRDHRELAKTAKARFGLVLQMAHKEKAALEEENQKLRRQMCRIPARVRTGAEQTRDSNVFPTAAAPVDDKTAEVVAQQRQKSPAEGRGYWGVSEEPHEGFVDVKSPGTPSMYCTGGSGNGDRGQAEIRNQATDMPRRQSSRKCEGNQLQNTRNRSLSQTASGRSGPPSRARCLTISTIAPVKATLLFKAPNVGRRYSEQTHRRIQLEDSQGCVQNSGETRCIQPEKYKGVARQESIQRDRADEAKKEHKNEWPFLGDDQEDLESNPPAVSRDCLAKVNKILAKKETNELGLRQKSTRLVVLSH